MVLRPTLHLTASARHEGRGRLLFSFLGPGFCAAPCWPLAATPADTRQSRALAVGLKTSTFTCDAPPVSGYPSVQWAARFPILIGLRITPTIFKATRTWLHMRFIIIKPTVSTSFFHSRRPLSISRPQAGRLRPTTVMVKYT